MSDPLQLIAETFGGTATYLLPCAALPMGCVTSILIQAPRHVRFDIYRLHPGVEQDRQIADGLKTSGWELDQGGWLCPNHGGEQS